MASDRFTPEIAYTASRRVACDGATGQPGSEGTGGAWSAGLTSPALGHPRVWLQIDDKGFVDCGYCDKRFILEGGPADAR